ncbi:MAG: serine kinase [Rhodobacteraceae bacterium]|nr:serine kinase [Paracoccaceae bacterium]
MAGASDTAFSETVHASCVAHAGRAVLIRGASGRGKSALALRLMALGAQLVADDRTELWREGETICARAPDTIRGMIEARFVGILAAEALDRAPVHLVIDLDRSESERLPPNRNTALLGQTLPLLYRVDADHFPASVMQYLAHGRKA